MKMTRFIRKSILLSIIVVLCTACGKPTLISDLLFNKDLSGAYLNEEAFTGKAWSDDGKTICLECVNGTVKQVTVYHSNGMVALQNTSLLGVGQSFDVDGNAISMEDFVQRYPRVVAEVQKMVNDMLYSEELE